MYIRLIFVRMLCHLPGLSNTSFGIYIYAYTCSMYINIHTKTAYIPIQTYILVCVYLYVQTCTYVEQNVYVHVVIYMYICYTWFRINHVVSGTKVPFNSHTYIHTQMYIKAYMYTHLYRMSSSLYHSCSQLSEHCTYAADNRIYGVVL